MRKVLLIAAALLGQTLLPHPALAQISDDELALRVATAIVRYPQYKVFDNVDVTVDRRVVTLSGRVTLDFKRTEIEDRVAKVEGVREVVNQIGVLPFSPSDEDLRQRIARAIYNHPSFWNYAQMPFPPIHIVVEHGRVTLAGTVNSETERALAFSLAKVQGSLDVTNRLRLDRR